MAGLALLNGVTGTQDFAVGVTTADKSYAGILNYISVRHRRGFFRAGCFRQLALRQAARRRRARLGRNEGYIPVGVANADPIYLFAGNAPLKYLVTIETGNTLAGTLWARREHLGIRAMGNSEFAFDWVGASGAPVHRLGHRIGGTERAELRRHFRAADQTVTERSRRGRRCRY
jgi:hypothetical protein